MGLPRRDRGRTTPSRPRSCPHLVHLQPPASAGRIWLERFSPLFTPADRFPLRYRSPERSYRYVYPAGVDLDRVAYFFDYELADALPDAAYEALGKASREWRDAWESGHRPRLDYRWTPGLLQIRDTRRPDQGVTHTLEGLGADLYVACSDRPRTAAGLVRELGRGADAGDVRACWRISPGSGSCSSTRTARSPSPCPRTAAGSRREGSALQSRLRQRAEPRPHRLRVGVPQLLEESQRLLPARRARRRGRRRPVRTSPRTTSSSASLYRSPNSR